MTNRSFRAGSLDHVELFVPDRYEAAAWYSATLGLEILTDFEFWAGADGSGPLMISSDGGRTKVALFEGQPLAGATPVGYIRMAFGTDGPSFLHFLETLPERTIHNRHGQRLTADQVVDHDRSWSIYFNDPYGNPLELTTYDYAEVAEALG